MATSDNGLPDRPDGPLSGLTVIDLTHVINGPFGTAILADMGARVIKVEPPQGDDTRRNGPYVGDKSLYFACVNRGKESIALNLKDEGDRALFVNMVRQADVVVENFRPGVMDRLGFSFAELQKLNPRIIYAASSGFGHSGPMSLSPAYDTIIQGMSGLMEATGFPDGPATRVGTSISDIAAGLYLYAGIVTALYDRERTGKGTQVDIAMFDATLAFLEHPFMAWAATGKAPERIGNRHPSMTPFDTFAAQDRPFVLCCGNDHLFAVLCATIDRPDLLQDPRFVTNVLRTEHHAALKVALEAIFSTRTAEDWIATLHDAGLPVGPLLDVAEATALPQTAARKMVVTAGGLKMPGNPIKLSSYADSDARPAAPDLDQHGAALRKEFTP
ncbi:CoA:oxalate CoA-transferase [Gluconacetobacter sp. 1c LMG 22058]|uniref:CoA:oxalate CoA-transferase n=1 Tax=Gluconacetobacter dulcium TaxID=2729096 RepID=A0A7W4PIH7_9PROT|nr:CoA:oxalate CoA-transferase [Gluconacetobacter dulcium]MBB2198790.1 CoA:oxalate CoA-transferase [Gluconacetobacter dulcium]